MFFWDSSGGTNQWEITAGLDSSLTQADDTYSFDGAGDTDTAPTIAASTLSFTTSIITQPSSSNRTLYGVNLGQRTVSGGSNIDVFIEQLGASGADRTWYDGVGYELVTTVPEPSSTALLGLGGLALILRRRR
ncbi:MAG: PEP-CTERM sorting domain-containing protein [Akkermansiaceae bacterium]